MQLTAQASSAAAPEQGVVGWSKVGCIETDKRKNLQTHKTDKLVNVNGWNWAQEQVKKPMQRPPNMKLFDTLDELVAGTQEHAQEQGLAEGADDDELGGKEGEEKEKEPEEDEDGSFVDEDTGETVVASSAEEEDEEDEEEEEEEEEVASDSGDDGYQTDDVVCPALPKRSAIKCNASK